MNAIGIDLGGTNLRIAKINEDGKILKVVKVATEAEKGSEQIADKMIRFVNEIKDEETRGIGIGVPGQVNNETKMVLQSTNVKMANFALAKFVEEGTNLKCIMNNDANVAALGEAKAGAGFGKDVVYYITWSTGIGGGLVINGKVHDGANFNTGEIGNLIIWPNSTYKHSIQNYGSWEGEAGGLAIKRYVAELGYDDEYSFFEAYRQGNEQVVEKVEYITDTFARGVANIMHTIEADKIVIGGGVALKSGDVLLPLVKKKVNNYVMETMIDKVIIDTAALGDDNGLIGASFLV
ncbi:ROK family protein [Mollicutes bacterium LVI A0039]|nr:ROK family protein [Mollicutes bacterium LVI A0039]